MESDSATALLTMVGRAREVEAELPTRQTARLNPDDADIQGGANQQHATETPQPG
jgi:hypothetical protein